MERWLYDEDSSNVSFQVRLRCATVRFKRTEGPSGSSSCSAAEPNRAERQLDCNTPSGGTNSKWDRALGPAAGFSACKPEAVVEDETEPVPRCVQETRAHLPEQRTILEQGMEELGIVHLAVTQQPCSTECVAVAHLRSERQNNAPLPLRRWPARSVSCVCAWSCRRCRCSARAVHQDLQLLARSPFRKRELHRFRLWN